MIKLSPAPNWHTETNPDVLLDLVRQREASTPAATSTQSPAVGFPLGVALVVPQFRQAASTSSPTVTLPLPSRRLQLFGCACARMVWEMLPMHARNAVLVRERFAEGGATEADLRASAMRYPRIVITADAHAATSAAYAAGYRWGDAQAEWIEPSPGRAAHSAAWALGCRAAGPAPPGGPDQQRWHIAWTIAFRRARAHQAELVRDIFPPPDHVPRFHADWRTSTVLTLARQADEAGEYSVLPILADALQDAGCDDEFMLDRCRAAANVHCRGNWVVDLVLGRE